MATENSAPTSIDAFVIIPGIMGSRLVEKKTGATLWGFDPAVFASAWLTGGSLERLHVTDDERAGTIDRVRPDGLLRFTGYAPGFLGIDKYSKLVSRVGQMGRHPDSVLEFAYDWRLSVEYNAHLLAKAATDHLTRWQAHPLGSASAQLVLIAHSMGGLVARYFTSVLGGASQVRTTITMGTPYYGSVVPAYMMATGRGAPVPLPHVRMKRMVRTMPGMHDLLPFYRSIRVGDEAQMLTPQIVETLGGDAELARESEVRHDRIVSGAGENLRIMVGVEQPTEQSLSVDGGIATKEFVTFDPRSGDWVDRRGDATVPRGSANAFGLQTMTLLGTHSSLPKTDEANAAIRDIVLDQETGPPLDAGGERIGIAVPDVIRVDEPLTVTVTLAGGGIRSASCRLLLITGDSETQVAAPPPTRAGDALLFRSSVRTPGLYRVVVDGGSAGKVSQVLMVTEPAELVVDEE